MSAVTEEFAKWMTNAPQTLRLLAEAKVFLHLLIEPRDEIPQPMIDDLYQRVSDHLREVVGPDAHYRLERTDVP